MKLESQVCSLELARKLRELGVVQESAFYWAWADGFEKSPSLWFVGTTAPKDANWCAAFTVAELGVALGFNEAGRVDTWTARTNNESEANLRASNLAHLLENGIITVDEVNKRLREAS